MIATTLQEMLASWSGPFAAAAGSRPGVKVVELSLVESVVRHRCVACSSDLFIVCSAFCCCN